MSYTVTSPDETVQVTITDDDRATPTYAVSYDGCEVIAPSAISLEFQHAPPFGPGVHVVDVKRTNGEEAWEPVWGATDAVAAAYTELEVILEDDRGGGRRATLMVRVFDDGIGLRFKLQSDFGAFTITSERTEFRFAADYTAWWIPGGTNRYEEIYRETPISEIETASTPLTIEAGEDCYIGLHEADLIDYAGMEVASLADDSAALESHLVPLPDGAKVKGIAPHDTPWRVIMLGESPGDLVESHIVEALNPPCALEDTSWIEPGKYVGVWWELHKDAATWVAGPDVGATTERTKRYIDFASEHDIPYVLAEGWNVGWEGWDDNDVHIEDVDFRAAADHFDLKAVLDYADEKGIEFIGHNETFAWAPQYESQLDEAFGWYDELGLPGIKTGYVGEVPGGHPHHDQWMVNHYRHVAKRGAAHRLMIDAHEPIKPTGETRTYPNFVTFEGVRGMEYNAWSEGNPPRHTVTVPFTRMLAGPLDYTPGIFNIEWDLAEKGTRVHSTRARQLALYPMLLSPLQMIADLPEHCEAAPSFEFVEAVPADWDETTVVNDAIGEYATIARRDGDEWYVGTGTDDTPHVIEIPLEFLNDGQYVAHVYTDGAAADLAENPTDVEISRMIVTAEDALLAAVVPGGGQAVHLVPASEDDAASYPRYAPPASEYAIEAPTDASPGESIPFSVHVENTGTVVGATTLDLTVSKLLDETREVVHAAERRVRVAAADETIVEFKVELPDPGIYEIAVDDGDVTDVVEVPDMR